MRRPILLAEQDSVVRRFIRRALEKGGFLVSEAATLEEARVGISVSPEPFALIIADIFLTDGCRLEEFISGDAKPYDTSILYLSTMPEAWLHEKELLRPNDRFLLKPFSPQELISKVNEVLPPHPQS